MISIIAGKCIGTLKDGLKHDAIVRAMPNTPAQIGYGMTVWTATEAVDGQQMAQTRTILGALAKKFMFLMKTASIWRQQSAEAVGLCLPFHGIADNGR